MDLKAILRFANSNIKRDGWIDVWMGGCKSSFRNCLQQLKIENFCTNLQIFSKINLLTAKRFVHFYHGDHQRDFRSNPSWD